MSYKRKIPDAEEKIPNIEETIPTARGEQQPGLEVQPPHDAITAADQGEELALPIQYGRQRRRLRCVWLLGAVVFLIVVLGAVLGGVLGSRASHSPSSASSSSTSPSSTSQASLLPSATSDPISATSSPTGISSNSRLASIAYPDEDNVLQYRVYYQDDNNTIKESAWNNSQATWYVLNDNIGTAKKGTPIAAAADPVGYSTQFNINLYAINDAGIIIEWYTQNGINWGIGGLTQMEKKPSAGSSLTTFRHLENRGCRSGSCALILVYQDDNSQLIMGNATGTNWDFSSIPANPTNGTGLALSLIGQAEYSSQLRLFYQVDNTGLVVADWASQAQIAAGDDSDSISGWVPNESDSLGNFPLMAPLAAFSFGDASDSLNTFNTTVTKVPLIVEVLTSGSNEVNSYPWFPGGDSTFEAAGPLTVTSGLSNFSAVAAHSWGGLYVLQDTGLVEYNLTGPDNNTWGHKGPVATV